MNSRFTQLAAKLAAVSRDLSDAVREVRVVALLVSVWMSVEITLWVTSADPEKLGGVAVVGIWTGTAALVAAVAAIAKRHTPPPER